ncbi:BSD domain-containing protein 1-like isoform X3 [Amblyraja radiata]|uniref:BSD domain-containing protein 1-like isoform X3 n=1 Tax=Amblyraja radiata TaxID=386614 RepID=UPI001403852F|nr:BSD domain-containing protein 1-like isoform X3 [Amblyraja radiata]
MADNWWGAWIQQNIAKAKAKSASAMELLKCDLAEFTQVIQNDTVSTIAATALAFKEKLNVEESTEGCHNISKGLSSFLGAISEAFTPAVEESDVPHVKTVKHIQMRISEPYDGVKVPNEVAHNDFWYRYFYKVHELHQEEERRTALKERAEQTAHSEDLKWEDDEDEWDGSSIILDAECRPNDVNLVTKEMHSSNPNGTFVNPEHSLEEASLRSTMTSISESTLHETQLLVKIPVEDSRNVKCKTFVGEVSQMSEALLEIEREHSNKGSSKEGVHNKLFDAKCAGEDTSGSDECLLSTSSRRNNESMHLLSNIEQNSRLQFDSNVIESSLLKESTLNSFENWDEEFDLDMTEEEIQMTLSRAEDLGEHEIEEWDDF